MKVLFRADASTRMGAGHVSRCATLGHELQKRGAHVSFACRAAPGNSIAWLREAGFDVESLPCSDTMPGPTEQYADWLGASMTQEIEEMTALLERQGGVDWLVADHYAIDARWERALQSRADRLMCIDDLANRDHVCDLLLDQNLYTAPERRYVDRLPATAKTLLGPRYALLRPQFLAAREHLRARDGSVQRLLLFMGGGDSANVTSSVLEALRFSQHGGVDIDVVAGGANPHIADLQARCAELPKARLHRQAGNMAAMMAEADLAIGATGVSTWERAALGLPALAVSVADNQRDIARHADAAGLLSWLGDAEEVSVQDWARHIDEACAAPGRLKRQSHACLDLVDARGAARVAEAML